MSDMSLLPDGARPEGPDAAPPAALAETRPFYWSLRRELWENRSIEVAPLLITGLVLFASLIHLFGLPHRLRSLASLAPAKQHFAVVQPFSIAPAPIMLVTFLIGLFYALDALYGERRDRSILFWKSLPVSDRTTVLAKASIPLVVLPLYAFLLSLATLAVMLVASNAILLISGVSPAPLWRELPFLQLPLVMFYGLAVHTLWFAPIYCWLLLVSAWARRMPLLWVVLPPVAIAVVERIVFGTSHFSSLIGYRVTGAMTEAFAVSPKHGDGQVVDRLWQLDPLRFLASPGLWLGLVFAGFCLASAVRLRRRGEKI